MNILMIESVCTKDGAFNVDEVYAVDKETAKEWIRIGYAIKVGGKEAAAKNPATSKATKRKVTKR
jgi:hypothetical protein